MGEPGFQSSGIRPAAVAGSWYTDDPRHLASQVEVMLEGAPPWTREGSLRALVAPHAGLRYSGPTAACSYVAVDPTRHRRVLVLAPNHRALLHGAAVDPSSHYESPLGKMPVDLEAVAWLAGRKPFQCSAEPFEQEHAIEMQLPFLRFCLPEASLVPVLIGEFRHAEELAETAASLETLLDDSTLLVVSTDFMHYGSAFAYVPFTENVPQQIHAYDAQAIDAITRLSSEEFLAVLERTGTTICGRHPLAVFLHLAPSHWKGELRSYTNSGEITGDWSHCVSYAALAFCEGDDEAERVAEAAEALVNHEESGQVGMGRMEGPAARTREALTQTDKKLLLQLARRSLERAAGTRQDLGPFDTAGSPALAEARAAFVSLHVRRNGRLRGCIGWLEPRGSLLEAVVANAATAATGDPRFEPVRPGEVEDLEIEISVLGPLQEVREFDEIQVGRDGLIIQKEGVRGVLLPQVPVHMHWDRVQFLENLCRKAGLPAQAWREGAQVRRFEAEIFSETDFGASREEQEIPDGP